LEEPGLEELRSFPEEERGTRGCCSCIANKANAQPWPVPIVDCNPVKVLLLPLSHEFMPVKVTPKSAFFHL